MNFSQKVDQDFVNTILESSLWQKNGVTVKRDEVVNESSTEDEIGVVDEYENGIANEYDEPQTLEGETDYREDKFTLEDLQYVLDNLEEEDLMEHAVSMLEVFDVAYEQIAEAYDEEYDEEEYYEDEEELEEAKKKGPGPGHGGGRRLRTGRSSAFPKGTSRAKRQDVAGTQNIGKRHQHELSAEEKADARGRQQDKDYEHGTGR